MRGAVLVEGESDREAVLALADKRGVALAERGVDTSSPAYTQLQAWLRTRPADAIFDTAVEAIKRGLSVLTPAERATVRTSNWFVPSDEGADRRPVRPPGRGR